MSVAKFDECRKDLLEWGFCVGNRPKRGGGQVWKLTIPNLWDITRRWRRKALKFHVRYEIKA